MISIIKKMQLKNSHGRIVNAVEIGILHPGEMGGAIANTLIASGHHLLWLPEGRSAESKARAIAAGIEAIESLDELVQRCEMILSICPPHAAVDVARKIATSPIAFNGVYLDANAVSPGTAAVVAGIVTDRGARYVDGGLIGNPPPQGHPRWYLSGPHAIWVAESFTTVPLEIVVLGDSLTAASALKMAYASWTKGTAALLLNIRAMAKHHGIDEDLLTEWGRSQSELIARCDQAALAALGKGWRWSGEMEEIAATFADINLPDGFGRAAAEVYKRIPRRTATGNSSDVTIVVDHLIADRISKPA